MKTQIQNEDNQREIDTHLDHVDCDLCGCNDTELRYVIQGMNIVQCSCCGLVYVNPRVPDPNPMNIYDHSYFDYYELTSPANRITYQKRLELLERYVPAKGSILDVGCSIGDFIEIARQRGWSPSGMDVSDAYVDHIRNSLGLPFAVGDFIEVEYESDSFDVVNMGDSLEHMLAPSKAVEKVFRILKPGGFGYIRVPDIDAWSPRLMGRRWIQLKPFEHFYYFTRATMTRLLTERGFEILEIGSSGTWCSLDILRNRFRHYYKSRVMNALLTLLADKLGLGGAKFYLDVREELQVIFRKPC
ncbi:class I SAM-dependent methyltransferase [bacterium]|nr:class I SAM-dependent methyltransferase [candidate division CSSED10-310 bacterium]